jgi:hypothetical protein
LTEKGTAKITATFDTDRAFLKTEDTFAPLVVNKTTPLRTALARRRVKPHTDLLLLNHPHGPIAFVKAEMAYHHVAQGEIAGEPYLVSF